MVVRLLLQHVGLAAPLPHQQLPQPSVWCCNAVTLILQRYSVTALNGQNPALQGSTSTDSVTALNGQPTALQRPTGSLERYSAHRVNHSITAPCYSVTALCYSVTALNGQNPALQRSTSTDSVTALNGQITALQRYSVTALQRYSTQHCPRTGM